MRKIGKIFRFLIPVIALVALVVFMTGLGRRERARLERNKAIVARSNEAWNTGNMAIADQCYAEDIVRYQAHSPEPLRGREAFKQHMTACRTAWPDFRATAEYIIAEGDKVVSRWMCTGTHEGTAWDIPPTGNEMKFESWTIGRIADGKIVEEWECTDTATLFQQMGFKLVPAEE